MSQQFPIPDLSPSGGNINLGNIAIEAPVAGDVVQIGHGNMVVFQLGVRGVNNATFRLNPQDPLLPLLMQMCDDGSAQSNQLISSGFHPTIVAPSLRAEDFQPDDPFRSPLGIPAPFTGDAELLARNFVSLNGFLERLDQQFGGTLVSLDDGRQSLNVSDLLLQRGNLALWRFRQGALRLFAEQGSLYALAELQDPDQPALGVFQATARGNLDVLRGWMLFQKYHTSQPTLIDQAVFASLSQGHWQAVLDGWSTRRNLTLEQVQVERTYLHALGERYDAQAVQAAGCEAEWYFRESLRRQPSQSAALVNLAALLSESALLAYIETGTADRARLQEARNAFQRAHELLNQRPDQDGKVALAQCLLYEAISLPPEARLEMVQWASSQAQQLRAALGADAPESLRWDMAQRNLARRDPGFFDWRKIEQARDILVGAGALAVLATLLEQWLHAHPQAVDWIKAEIAHHLPPSHLEHSGGVHNPTHMHVPGPHPPGVPHIPPGVSGGIPRTPIVRTVVHKVLGTTAKKIVAGLLVTAVVGATVVGVLLTHRGTLPFGTITEFTAPMSNNSAQGITIGSDGNLWFTENKGGKIGRITPTGIISEFPLTGGVAPIGGITVGPDGDLWFTAENSIDYSQPEIGRITPTGIISEFPLPIINQNNFPSAITAGPDGDLWFTELTSGVASSSVVGKIGRITPTGVVSEFSIPSSDRTPLDITAGPDGDLWFTENNSNKIGRITPAGHISEFSLPGSDSEPAGIAAGPDGNLWFTEDFGNKIGRITPAGHISEFPIPTPGSSPEGITAGPNGNLWFTEYLGNKIGEVWLSGGTTSNLSSPQTPQPTTQASVQGGSSQTCPAADTLHQGIFTNVIITLPPGCVVNFVVTKVGHFTAGFPKQTPGDYEFDLGKSFISNISGYAMGSLSVPGYIVIS